VQGVGEHEALVEAGAERLARAALGAGFPVRTARRSALASRR